jgi:hypothetical protein
MIFDPKPRPRPDIPPLPERRDPNDNSYTYEDKYGLIHWSTSDEDEE